MSEHDEPINDVERAGPGVPEPTSSLDADAGAAGTEPASTAEERSSDRPGSAADLDRIAQLPLSEQPAAYRTIHDDLQRALAEIDEA